MPLTLVSARCPRYATPENKSILLLATFKEIPHHGEILFHAHPEDTEDHGVNTYNRAIRGDFGPIQPSETTPEEHLENVKKDLCHRLDVFAAGVQNQYSREANSPHYSHKVDEARRAVKEKSPSADEYPLLASMIGHDDCGDTIGEVARKLLQRDKEWRKKIADIDLAKKAGRTCVEAAISPEHARSVFSSLRF